MDRNRIILLCVLAVAAIIALTQLTGKNSSKLDGTYTSNAYGGSYEMVIKGKEVTFTAFYSMGDRVDHGKIEYDGETVKFYIDGEYVPTTYDESTKTLVLRDEMVFVKQ